MSLTYKVPEPISGPFVVGELVEVCSRELKTMSKVKIAMISKEFDTENGIVTLVDGRTFRARDGWFLSDDDAYPFPSIRHQKKFK